tara:strand:+ start:9965 stop:11353 length:1389 start_codon:yes stop_codon:yes gene_type:complete
MNIKKIIREELSTLSDSFYLLVSDDEKFIYGTGKLGGKSFQPVENFDAEAILRSRYGTEDAAFEQISWAEYYKGGRGTPGEIADNMLKHNPKVVPVDFILRKRDESFPIIESNELDWIKNVDPLSGGKYYNHTKVICFGDQERWCDVRIANGYITFYLNKDEFGKFWDENGYWEDDSWIMEPIFMYGTPHDGDGDWYEFDSDEFNYSYYRLDNNQIVRFNEILKTVGSDEEVGNFEDSMNSLIGEFNHPKIQANFDNMIGEYLNQLGYVIQRNRWLSISHQWDSVSKEAGVEVSMSSDEIKIKIPIEKAYQDYYNKDVNDLTELLKAIFIKLSHTHWYEWFYDEWDTSGSDDELDEVFSDFLDYAEDYIESEDFEKWKKVLSDFEELGIKNKNAYWYNYQQLIRENPNDDTIWVIKLKNGYDEADIGLFKIQHNSYYGNQKPIKPPHLDVPVEEIPKYIKPL